MNENEAIEVLNNFDMQVSAKADGAYQSTIGETACKVAVRALQEIREYREIGTAEEFKALKDKATPKKPAQIDNCGNKCASIRCQACFEIVGGDYCECCGQRQDWESAYKEIKS